MTTARCPVCQKSFEVPTSTSLPFCSERCRLVDLNRWVEEKYGLPHEGDDELPTEQEDSEDQ